jgi:hypothetical protein
MTDPIITLAYATGKKTWCAFIRGRSRMYGFDREFLCPMNGRKKGKKGKSEYLLEEGGVYELCEKDERSCCQVREGVPVVIDKKEVLVILAAIAEKEAKAKRATENEVDWIIARINGEGAIISEN